MDKKECVEGLKIIGWDLHHILDCNCANCKALQFAIDNLQEQPKEEEPEILYYKLSNDKVGLLAHYKNGGFYHIHSDELSSLEKWIHKILLNQEQPNKSKLEKAREELEKIIKDNEFRSGGSIDSFTNDTNIVVTPKRLAHAICEKFGGVKGKVDVEKIESIVFQQIVLNDYKTQGLGIKIAQAIATELEKGKT